MKVIGITGGVGSGKSAVLSYMEEEFGAYVCQLDMVAKQLQEKGKRCYEEIVEYFGEDILGEDKNLDRKALGDIVFKDNDKLEALNKIVHPAVKDFVIKDIKDHKEKGTKLYIIEAALMPTAGYDNICDEMWYIFTEENVRRDRLKASRGYSDEKITEMIMSQPSEEDFRRISSVVIDNSNDIEFTKKQIRENL